MKPNIVYTVNPYNKDLLYKQGMRWQASDGSNRDSKGGWFNMSKEDNPFSKMNINETLSGLSSVVSPFLTSTLSGDYNSTIGNGISTIGNAVSNFLPEGPLKWAVGLGSGVLGGIGNRLLGQKVDEKALSRVNSDTAMLNNYKADATSFDDVKGIQGVANVGKVYKGGIFNKGVEKKNAILQDNLNNAKQYAYRTQDLNIDNLKGDQLNGLLAHSAAYGGALETAALPQYTEPGIGVAEYDFMKDYLTTKRMQAESKNKLSGVQSVAANNMFALGGDYQTNGADWTNGLVSIGAGGSHEENPNQGVQMGVDPEGTPNLVEEGERIFNDYVYSKRIFADGGTLEKFHLSKKRKISFADLAGLLEKESKERPNDPISIAALKVQMEQLAEQQERQKQEMEAARAREAFEALSPEEQTAIMQQVAQQEQRAQEQAIQEQAAMQQQAAELSEMAAAEGQPVAEEMQSGVPTGAPMMAKGGKLYSPGGKLDDIYDAENDHFTVKDFADAIAGREEAIAANTAAVEKAVNKEVLKRIPENLRKKMSIMQFLGSLGYKTVKEAEKAGWKPSDFGKYSNWNDIKNTTMLPDDFEWSDDYAARIDNPAMKAAMSLGYNPLLGTLQRQWYEGDNGNDVGWTQSVGKKALTAKEFNDYAKRYKNTLGWAIEQGLIKAPKDGETISTTDIMRAMQQSPDWQATDKWLYSDLANQAKYLGMARGMNPSDDTKFVSRWSPYGTFTKGKDGSWTYNLKDNLTDAEKQAFTDQFKRTRNDGWLGVMYNNFHDPGLTTNRYVLDEKGNPTLLLSDDLTGYEQVGGPFTWGDEDAGMNNQAIFYRAKGTGTGTGSAGAGSTDGKAKGDDWDVEPIHRNDKLRYAGLFGPAVGLGMQLAGIGRPDTSGLDAAVNMSRGAGHLADYQPIGDYMRYQPLDRLFYANQLQANARATDRNLMNTSGGNRGAAMAGLLANNYNTNNNLGNLWRQAEEYNLAQRERVAAFNKDTNKFNADAYNTTSRFNADALNRQGQYSAQLAMQAAREKMDADAAWNQGIYGNVAGLFKGIGDLGRENAQHNMIADMAATGIFGTIKNQPIGNGYIRVVPRNEAAKGGKINKKKGKRGLTY